MFDNQEPSRTTEYDYDALSRLREIRQPSGAPQRVQYDYDGRSRLYRVTNGRNNVLEYAYFNWGGLGEVHHFGTAADADNSTPPAHRIIGYSYDYEGNLLSVADSDLGGAGEAFAGILPTESNPGTGSWLLGNRLYDYSYDALNRVVGTSVHYMGLGVTTLTNSFDSRGNRTGLAVAEVGGDTLNHTWCFDPRDRLEGMLPPGVTGTCGTPSPAFGSYAFTYEPNNGLRDVTHSNDLITRYSYLPHGPVQRILTDANGVVPADPFDLVYLVDELLNIESIDEFHDGALYGPAVGEPTSYAFGYDSAQRLATAAYPNGSGIGADGFVYDKRGNRDDSGASAFSYNENNQLIATSPTLHYCYDDDGNLERTRTGADCATGTDLRTLVWDMTNRLVSVSEATTFGTYIYDPFGRRISKVDVAGTTRFLWDGDQLLAEYDSSAVRQRRYAYALGFSPVQFATGVGVGEESYDVHEDYLGTPRLITDGNGAVVWRAYYEGYGSVHVDPISTLSGFNIRFPGQYYDAETGLHYNRYRYYDPSIGRYISADPIGQIEGGDANLYAYVWNDPVNLGDPLGLYVWPTPAPVVAPSPVAPVVVAGAVGFAIGTAIEPSVRPYVETAIDYYFGDPLAPNGTEADSATDCDPQAARKPYEEGKPGRKRQGRENDQDKKKPGKGGNRKWRDDNPPREPKPHTPSRKKKRRR